MMCMQIEIDQPDLVYICVYIHICIYIYICIFIIPKEVCVFTSKYLYIYK
jgi:hypothetical protein